MLKSANRAVGGENVKVWSVLTRVIRFVPCGLFVLYRIVPVHAITYEVCTTYGVCTFECKQCGEARSRTVDHWTKTEIPSDALSA